VAHYNAAQQRLLTERPGLTSVASLAFRDESALLVGSADEVERLYLTTVMPAKLALELQYLAQRTWRRDVATLWRSLACSLRALVGWVGQPGAVADASGPGAAGTPTEPTPPPAAAHRGDGRPTSRPAAATVDPPLSGAGPSSRQEQPAPEGGTPRPGAAQAPLTYWRRYLAPLLRYGTPRKFVNLAGAGLSYALRRPHLHSRPAFLKVELCRRCDVNCLYCAAEWYHSPYAARPSALYPLPAFERLIDALAKEVFFVSLYDIGEPLHHPQVLDCIRYAHNRRLGTVLSSSLSLTRDEVFWRDLVNSGLDLLIVAIDGVTPEVYRQYRRNGRFDLVMANLRTILAQRQQTGARLAIEWQMVDLPWNRAEQGPARALAQQLGCDRFRVITEATGPRRRQQAAGGHRERGCVLPYVLLFVGADQRARACYKVYNQDMSVGNLVDEPWTAVWNGARLAAVRDRQRLRDHPGCCTCRE
jgi:MoaA/NifB/PqqE/SkfB family radical SAM enzyme